MSATFSPTQLPNAQIIKVLCQSTMTFDEILSGLQRRYPTSGWTSALLETQLAQSIPQGRVVRVTTVPVAKYQLNLDMAYNNPPVNTVYQFLCPQIRKRYDCN